MPNAKRLKSDRQAQSKANSSRQASDEADGESDFSRLARQHWLKSAKRPAKVKVKNDVLKSEIWDSLERDGFHFKSLHALEGVQALESYLWPGYVEESSNHHVLLIVLIVNVKKRERLHTWPIFEDRPDDFSSLFRRVLSLSLDQSLPVPIRTNVLAFIIHAFQSLDCSIVRKECAPLVSISIWHNLSTEEKRDDSFDQNPRLRKAWRAAAKRIEAADDATKSRIRFERSWLYSLVLDFFRLLGSQSSTSDDLLYCERFMEFMIDLQSQMPTRRYVKTLLQDLHILAAIKLSPAYNDESNGLIRDLHVLLRHYTHFCIDDQTGVQHSATEAYDHHCAELAKLQRIALKHFKEKLAVLALSNYGSIVNRSELANFLEPLSDEEIVKLASLLHLRTALPGLAQLSVDRKFLVEVLLSTYERVPTFQESAREMSVMPTERTLYEQGLLRTDAYDGSRPLALPKLNLQYLSVGDFLWRAFVLFRCEAFYGIRRDIESALQRLRPQTRKSGETSFTGSSRMALPIAKPAILEVVPALVGDNVPSLVRAEVAIDLRHVGDRARRDWESLRPGDVLFLVAVDSSRQNAVEFGGLPLSEAHKCGVQAVRCAEVIQALDDRGRAVRDSAAYSEGRGRSTLRRIQLKIDASTYQSDLLEASAAKADVYGNLNLLVRRSGRENNFKPVLESIKGLIFSDVPLAPWLHEVFLGYGDPAAATYRQLHNRIKTLEFRDTFLNWQHLVESLPGKIVEPGDDVSGSFGPPYVLETVDRPKQTDADGPSKKRRRDAEPALIADVETLKVSTYKPASTGPYVSDAPKSNMVRFTPAQIEAIFSGTQPGLTVIAGPPGTGKTDVATQIISNIYHNFPQQRTLLIAHSNQALNQLFGKIVALDIDQRHLLRLGHGEEDLDAGGDFSKAGRVHSFLQNRDRYLQEVSRLAACIGAPGAHGNSAETAGYFHSVYVEPAWARFMEFADKGDSSATQLAEEFPFALFFADAPRPLFPLDGDREAVLDVAHGCYQYISKIFSELADAMPFEILRREKDKANYLLTREARIIAMTSTHAAMRRGEIASLGFHYHNVVVEEAAQITEIESFIPLAMQEPKDGQLALQRVVLCGDHLQNSPIIQSLAFRHYANLEQSLFSRLVQLGVPTIKLDQQGRARPSIASLYRWRYLGLGDLPSVQTDVEFLAANAGFRYDYQFIDVPDFMGRGEMEPTPHFIQNTGEAEYAVAIYQYMRLLGYPAEKISILTTYAGQRDLVKKLLGFRCAREPVHAIFGLPKIVTTVDKYQGEQNDYVILSLTRTSRVGYLRDIRRITVALSRARLGLYVLGRRQVFESCFELGPAFKLLLERPDKLALVSEEVWPTERRVGDEMGKDAANVVSMQSVEDLGQLVFKMTETRLKQFPIVQGVPTSGFVAVPPPLAGEAEIQTMQAIMEDVDEEKGGEASDSDSPERLDAEELAPA